MGARTLAVGAPAIIRAAVPQAPEARVEILHNGRPLATGKGSATFSGVVTEGGYRVEVFDRGARVPWLVSNAIYAGQTTTAVAPEPALDDADDQRAAARQGGRSSTTRRRRAPGRSISTRSSSTTRSAAARRRGSTPRSSRRSPATSASTASSSSPTRRSPSASRCSPAARRRTRRPALAALGLFDQTPRTFVVRLRDLESVDRQTTLRPNVARVQTVLFVVDTLNAMPGSSGSFWIFDAKSGSEDSEGLRRGKGHLAIEVAIATQ